MMDRIIELLERARRARREHRPQEALAGYQEAVSLGRQSGARLVLIQALKGLGQIERDLGRNAAARPQYEEAVALCREEGDPDLLAHTVRHLGDIHQDAGSLDLAERCFHEALALYRNNESTALLDLANAIRPLAMLMEATGAPAAARPLWEEARDLYASAHVPEGATECATRLARLEPGPPTGQVRSDT